MNRPPARRGRTAPHAPVRALAAAFRREDALAPFGPTFFLSELAAFVRDRCPTPAEGLPTVLVHLADGEVLHLCHVIGVSARWAAMAVRVAPKEAPSGDAHRMRTVLLPYGAIARLTVQPESLESADVGFRQAREPVAMALAGGRATAP